MGKTMKRQRKLAAKAAAANPQPTNTTGYINQTYQKKPFRPTLAGIKGYKAPNAKTIVTTGGMTIEKKHLSARITEAFVAGEWAKTLTLLTALGVSGSVPKLGSVQRWVRYADLATDPKVAARLLCAIIDATTPKTVPGPSPPPSDQSGEDTSLPTRSDAIDAAPMVVDEHPVIFAEICRHPDWVAPPAYPRSPPATPLPLPQPSDYANTFHTIEHEPTTAGRNIPTNTGAPIFVAAPNTIKLDPAYTKDTVGRVECPFIKGAICLTGVLSPLECQQIIALSNAMGYTSDVDYSFGTVDATNSASRTSSQGDRAVGCVWLADDSFLYPLFERVRPHLHQEIAGCALTGINARFRLYRYDQGNVYRPHIDGAWPASGIKDGKYVYDATGDQWSQMTFLFYLNDDFEGGATTFFNTAVDKEGEGKGEVRLDARGIRPKMGNIMVFPHGYSMGSLVHEGSAVTKGFKHVIRTEVLYMKKGKGEKA